MKNRHYQPKVGTCFVHTVIDDYTRLGYAECHDDETAATAVAVLYRAVAWFAERGVTVERVLSDNGSAYRSFLWRDTCEELGIKVKKTQVRRPQTNGKIERFHRTMSRRLGLPDGSTTQRTPDEQHWQDGSTSTTTTGPTQRSAANHPSPGWTTWLDITARP